MPAIHELWAQYSEVCDYTPLNTLPETANLFAMFTPMKAFGEYRGGDVRRG
jgi:hypothetical protein